MIPAHHGALTRTVVSGVLVAVATIASMFALGEIIEPGAWTRAGVVGVILVAACTSLTRWALLNRAMNRAGPRRETGGGSARESAGDHAAERAAGTVSFLATLVGLAVASWYVLARYGTATGELTLLVGVDEWRWVLDRFAIATNIMTTERAPVEDSLPIGMVAVGGTLLMFLVADSLAGARMPAMAGLPLLVLWTPSLSIMGRIPAGTFVVAVTAALLLLTLDQSGSAFVRGSSRDAAVARARRSRAWITAVSSVVVAVLALGTGAVVAAVPGVATGFSQIFRTQGQSLELSDEFDMRAGLGARSSAEVLSYEISDPEQRGPLRERTFTAWDGRRVSWDPRDGGLVDVTPESRLMSGTENLAGGSTTLDVRISSDRDGLLPIPGGPRRVIMPPGDDRWRWDPVLDEVRSDGRLTEGTQYTVEMLDRGLSPEALRAAGDGMPASADYLELEETEFLAETAELARAVTEGARTRYDQAVALQNWLHHEGGFTYTPDTAPARTNDATWDFLTDRQGYCVQFSTAYFVMARSLGIPTRIGVGYLPGSDEDGDGVWSVTGQDSHSWPEVWFQGFGWVRFEPTPQVQTGPLPDYANPVAAPGPAPTEVPEERRPTSVPEDEPDEEPTAEADPAGGGAAGRGGVSESLPWEVWAGTAAGALAVCAVGLWLLLRRRQDSVTLDPEQAWERVVAQLAERNVVLGPSTTLRQAPGEIAEQVRTRTGNPLPDETAEGIVALAHAAENERYAREYMSPSPAQLDELTATVSAGISETLGSTPDTAAARVGEVLTQALRR
ncbi:transglutaminaseTgpA domain-containing protein [Myceligenerans pegani]|uniref:Transglutaminase-like domain-containing protein n=1 Tax=Myceligenerans pegani TaxID=2776917 RepID=A0ABR9MYJ1_9MICO|nr:transglutaminase domain-containing protein [Myceligenerans sp. TRM 65318]MBE1876437.1 hypothetical protein [Myceligenerans sp. TRM 65318]MBE3018708.1 hypothetical protein [Myceligenerans sp. TRM 65318]